MAENDEQSGFIDGPVVQGGGTTESGEPIGTEIGGGRATGGVGRGGTSGGGPGGTTGGSTGSESDPRQGPEWDADAVDETGALDDVGETVRGEPGPGDQRDDPEARSRAFEDQPDSSW
jgi:hypothetical protein